MPTVSRAVFGVLAQTAWCWLTDVEQTFERQFQVASAWLCAECAVMKEERKQW